MEKKERNGLIKSSFRSKLIISITALSILMVLIVAFVSIQIANSKIVEMARLQSENNARNAAMAIDNYYSDVDQFASQILQIDSLQEIASADSLPDRIQQHPVDEVSEHNSTGRGKRYFL